MDAQSLRRLELPSGGWWVLDTRISHRVASELIALLNSNDSAGLGRVLSGMTVDWGFSDSPSAEAVMQREIGDIEAATSVIRDDLIPALQRSASTEEAERVFEALVSGQMPGGYSDIALMESTGWSWQELQETPEGVVRGMRMYLSVKSVVEQGWES
jgi:hypothetical protein